MRRFNWIYFFINFAFLFWSMLLLVLLSVSICFLLGSLCANHVIAAVRLFHYVFYFILLFWIHCLPFIRIKSYAYISHHWTCVCCVFFLLSNKWYEVDWFTGRVFFCLLENGQLFCGGNVCLCSCLWCVLACCFIDIDCWISENVQSQRQQHPMAYFRGMLWFLVRWFQLLPTVAIGIVDVDIRRESRLHVLNEVSAI